MVGRGAGFGAEGVELESGTLSLESGTVEVLLPPGGAAGVATLDATVAGSGEWFCDLATLTVFGELQPALTLSMASKAGGATLSISDAGGALFSSNALAVKVGEVVVKGRLRKETPPAPEEGAEEGSEPPAPALFVDFEVPPFDESRMPLEAAPPAPSPEEGEEAPPPPPPPGVLLSFAPDGRTWSPPLPCIRLARTCLTPTAFCQVPGWPAPFLRSTNCRRAESNAESRRMRSDRDHGEANRPGPQIGLIMTRACFLWVCRSWARTSRNQRPFLSSSRTRAAW